MPAPPRSPSLILWMGRPLRVCVSLFLSATRNHSQCFEVLYELFTLKPGLPGIRGLHLLYSY